MAAREAGVALGKYSLFSACSTNLGATNAAKLFPACRRANPLRAAPALLSLSFASQKIYWRSETRRQNSAQQQTLEFKAVYLGVTLFVHLRNN